MQKEDLERYFDDNKYYDSKIIITILEDIMRKEFKTIKNDVNNSNVKVTEDEIKKYLEQKLILENPELKKRIEIPKTERNCNLGELTDQDIHNAAQRISDSISIKRYKFEPYALEYFKKYIAIIKKKIDTLLSIIEAIGSNKSEEIKDQLFDLDINLNESGNITRDDIVRLIFPTVYNIGALNEKVNQANDLSTYLDFKMSIHSLYRHDISESEIYPTTSIQVKNLFYDDIKGNVPLSDKQISELREEQDKNIEIGTQLVLGLFD